MKTLRRYIFVVDSALGAGAFSGIFSSSLAVPERILVGCGLVLIAFLVEFYFLQSDISRQQHFEALFVAIEALEKRLLGNDARIAEALAAKAREF